MTVTNEEAADFLSESFVGGGEHAAEALALCSAAFDKLAAFELMVECSYASEETFCSSWDDTTVSQIMRGDVGPAGLGEVDAETVAKCHRLASRAGGWWVRNPNHPFGAPGFWLHFVPLSLCGCNVDHDTCSAEQRSGTGRAAQGTCVRGVVDLVAASADDQHAAERGTPAAGAEVTASDGGDTARADSAVAELREAASMLAEADRRERQAAALDPYDSVRRACLGYEAKRLRREAGERIASWRERAAVGERRKWAAAIASALDGADRSGCESFVSREEMASRVAAMRAELERERKLRREAEEAFKTANGMRNEEARRRGLTVGARVRGARSGVAFGVIAGFNKSGDPYVFDRDGGYGHADGRAYIAEDLELDTEATT